MENWKFALSSIRSHKMRSFLTMIGIIIGVSCGSTYHGSRKWDASECYR